LMTTGSQGEPTSALVRIANRDHQEIEVEPGDTVIISASPIPGNETVVAKTIDNLFRQGANVLHSRTAMVHVHGHASREELKMMLSLVNPRFFVPVHGEYRHLVTHAALAQSMGIPESNTFVLEDGDVLELTSDGGRVVGRVPAGHLFVSGHKLWKGQSEVLNERKALARNGVVSVAVSLSSQTGEVRASPSVKSYGFVELDESQELLERTSKEVLAALEDEGIHGLELTQVESRIRDAVSGFLEAETRRRPAVIVLIDEI